MTASKPDRDGAQTVARGHGTGVRWETRGGCGSTHSADADSVKGHLSGARLRHDGNVNSAEDRGLAPALSGQVRPWRRANRYAVGWAWRKAFPPPCPTSQRSSSSIESACESFTTCTPQSADHAAADASKTAKITHRFPRRKKIEWHRKERQVCAGKVEARGAFSAWASYVLLMSVSCHIKHRIRFFDGDLVLFVLCSDVDTSVRARLSSTLLECGNNSMRGWQGNRRVLFGVGFRWSSVWTSGSDRCGPKKTGAFYRPGKFDKRGGYSVTTLHLRLPGWNQRHSTFHVGDGPTPALWSRSRGSLFQIDRG